MAKNENKMRPTENSVYEFLDSLSEKRKLEGLELIEMMKKISKEEPVLWGDSIIGFGIQHYKYPTGREGDVPLLAFSPRKARVTIYFNEGFDQYYREYLEKLGKYKTSVSCLYINKLSDVDLKVLEEMLTHSFQYQSKCNWWER